MHIQWLVIKISLTRLFEKVHWKNHTSFYFLKNILKDEFELKKNFKRNTFFKKDFFFKRGFWNLKKKHDF